MRSSCVSTHSRWNVSPATCPMKHTSISCARTSPCPWICALRYSTPPKPPCANFAKRRNTSTFPSTKATTAAPAHISRACARRGSRLTLPLLPSRLEQRQVVLLLVRMLQNLFDVQIDTPPRPVGHFDGAIPLLLGMRPDLPLPRFVELVEQFVNEEIGNGGVKLHARRRANRPLRRSEERRVGKEGRSRWSPHH